MKNINGFNTTTIDDALAPILGDRFAKMWADIEEATGYIDRLLVMIHDHPKVWTEATRELDGPTRALLIANANRLEAMYRSLSAIVIAGAPWA